MKYKPTFFLKEPNADRESPVNAHIYYEGKRFKLSTGMLVHPKQWDFKNQRAKKSARLSVIVNDQLDRISLQLATIFMDLWNNGLSPTPELLRKQFDALHKPKKEVKPVEFFPTYDQFIESLKGRLQETTLKVHRTTKGHLEEFQKTYGIVIDFDRFNVPFFDTLIHFLTQTRHLNNVTAWKAISTLRVFLKYAVEQEYTTNKDYEQFTRKRMPRGEKSEKVYVSLVELEQIKTLKISDSRLDLTRDLFLFQAHTGLRYGDVHRIGQEHVYGDELRLVTSKNKKTIRTPLLPLAKKILEKYDYRLPKRSNQKQNKYLKELCKEAKIKRMVEVIDYKGVERIAKTIAKHELIGTHTAKRTYVSLLRQHGVSVEAICRFTGNSRQSIEHYILKDEEDMASEVAKVRAALA